MKKIFKIFICMAIVVFTTFGFISCKQSSGEPKTETITLSTYSLSLKVGDTQTITATSSVPNAVITWVSSDETIACVSEGQVTAVKSGKAMITAVAGNVTASCKVLVEGIAMSTALDLRLNVNEVSLLPKSTYDLQASLVKGDDVLTLGAVEWKTTDANVATVNNGKITTIASGECQIIATTNYEGETVTAVCAVVVVEAEGSVFTGLVDMDIMKGETVDVIPTFYFGSEKKTDVTIIGPTVSDANVLSITDGKLTALKKGTATIAVSCEYEGETYTATTSIRVREKYTVTFMHDNEPVAVKTVLDGELVEKWNTIYRKDGFAFGGWTDGSTTFDFDTPVEEDLTLSIKWLNTNYKLLAYDQSVNSENITGVWPANAFWSIEYTTSEQYENEAGAMLIKTGTLQGYPTYAAGYQLESVDFEKHPLVYFYVKTDKRWEVSYGDFSTMYTMEANTWTKCTIISNYDGTVNVYFGNECLGTDIKASNLNSTCLYLRRPQDAGEMTAHETTTAYVSAVYGASQQFKVTFMDGETVLDEKMVNDGACVDYTGNIEKEGRVAVGWTLNGEDFSFDTPITEDITLQAKKWYVWSKVLAYDESVIRENITPEWPATAFWHAEYTTTQKYGNEAGCMLIKTGTLQSYPTYAAGYKLESVDFEKYPLVYFYVKTDKCWEVSYGSSSTMYTMEANTWTKCTLISNGDGTINVYFNDILIGQNIEVSNLNSACLYLRRPQNAGEMTAHESASAYVSAVYGASQQFKVTLKDGETVLDEKMVNDGACVVYTGNLEKEGSVIVGWTLNGEDFSFGTPITEDITLQAKWSVWSKALAYDESVIRDNIKPEWPATAFWHAEYTTTQKHGNEAGCMLIKTGTLQSYPTYAAGYKLESVDFENYPLVYFYIMTNKRWEVGYGSSSQMYTMEANTWTKCMIISNGDGTVNVYFNDTLVGQNIEASNLNSACLYLRRPQDAGEMTANEGAEAYVSAVYGASKE